jgi:glycerol-3-phosphate dehydrogenase
MTKEWARFPDDILWRRSKLGLTTAPADREALAAYMAKVTSGGADTPGATRSGAVEPGPIHR